jgi:thiol-disulfide isomerase/thioredoxin
LNHDPSPIARALAAAILLGSTAIATVASWGAPTASSAMYDYGAAPEITGIDTWLNSEPLSLHQLQGKVVLIDFWTYSCINCLRTLPYVSRWHDKFKDRGLVVIGVHTPEFGYEKSTRNVVTALQRLAITYPVAQDNRYETWKAFGNEYWPAVYLVDRSGHIRLKHVGEGDYTETEEAIDHLLDEKVGAEAEPSAVLSKRF